MSVLLPCLPAESYPDTSSRAYRRVEKIMSFLTTNKTEDVVSKTLQAGIAKLEQTKKDIKELQEKEMDQILLFVGGIQSIEKRIQELPQTIEGLKLGSKYDQEKTIYFAALTRLSAHVEGLKEHVNVIDKEIWVLKSYSARNQVGPYKYKQHGAG